MQGSSEFKTGAQRQDAFGTGLHPAERRFYRNIAQFWKPMQQPQPGEWLYDVQEPGQSYKQFRYEFQAISPTKVKNCIYILPLDEMISAEMQEYILQLCTAFFMGVNVAFLPPINLADRKLKITNRENSFGKQYHAEEILIKIAAKLPANGFCLVGITMHDIYPREEWNFVYGLARKDLRSGVFSFCRHKPENIPDPIEERDVLFQRAGKTLTHEIGHLFGIKHCIFYECLMSGNGGGHEAYKYPPWLCPICLRKLQYCLKFDISNRYSALEQVSNRPSQCFTKTRQWYEERIADLSIPIAEQQEEKYVTSMTGIVRKQEERKVANSVPNSKKK